MAKRPGAVVLAAGALFALCCPGTATAQDRPGGESLPRQVTGGYVGWSAGDGETADRGLTFGVTAPAVRHSGGPARFPAVRGAAGPADGAADVELGGTARFGGTAAQPLVLAGLRLRLTGDEGVLHARTVVDGRARELALADVTVSGADSAVRADGWSWTGLAASLTEEGAKLLSSWSGTGFAAGDGLGELGLAVETEPGGDGTEAEAGAEGPAHAESPQGSPVTGSPQSPAGAEEEPTGRQDVPEPAAAVALAALAAGAEQTVTGTGFAPDAVVLVAIDGDTRYQAVAGADGRFTRSFPVYATAFAGEHTVELTAVSGGQAAAVRASFAVTAPD